VTILTLTQ